MFDIVTPNLAFCKWDIASLTPDDVYFIRKMKRNPSALTILAENLRAVIDASGRTPTAWATAHKMPPRNIQRILKCQQSPSLDTLQEIADAAGILSWQLLVPGLDPSNPPVVTLNEAERDFYRRLKKSLSELPPI